MRFWVKSRKSKMSKLKDWGKRLLNWAIVNPWIAFRKWLNKSRFVAFIVGAAIAGSFIFCYLTVKYEYRNIFNSRVVILNNSSVALASTVRESAGSNQEVEKVAFQEVRGEEQSSSAIQAEKIADLAGIFKLKTEDLENTIATVKRISDKSGFDWRIPMAIIMTESKGGKVMVGDSGLSKGWYHIYHLNVCELNGDRPNCISDQDRLDLKKSTQWTIDRLKRHENMGRREMIRSHNGLIADNSNQWYVDYVEELIQKYF